MENIINRIAYLEGLAEGYEIDEESKEGRLIFELIDVIAEMAEEVKIAQDEMEEYVDIIEEDLSSLEEYVYDDLDEDYDSYDDFDFDDDFYFEEEAEDDNCSCGNCSDEQAE
ncbi:hypothetical protein SAMN02745245_00233 [Anaerosphaera aminiphila DSM 21120]|uniref:Uncharacterized protein n=1 Tax=Anaerosphaera aminiphila DSM 21120 TaxID=1120995 RepID=A0A1M5P9I0_9FIRM|nr:CD1247 N-terminal domain-containing protein [Anaerosphaera aminiphila]SHG98428.1 hypothetical protein SAMN02745245_00233 [Anaerosphaera aminiphila DSM 21120]